MGLPFPSYQHHLSTLAQPQSRLFLLQSRLPMLPRDPERLGMGRNTCIIAMVTQVSHLPLVAWRLYMQINHNLCWVNLRITPNWLVGEVEVQSIYMFVYY